MQVKALKLRNEQFGQQWFTEIENHWNYRDFLANERWRKGWISFDCCAYLPETDRVYCGITSFDADIFWAYDRATGRFVDCGYGQVRDPYDAKFHRALAPYRVDGCLYASVALLHDIDRYWEAPGAAIVRYHPRTGEIHKLATPLPHVYVQSIALDQNTGVIYGFTLTPERMFRFDIATGQARDLGPIGSGITFGQGENIELDDAGCAWAGWTVTRAWQSQAGPDCQRLCKYDPRQDRIIYYNAGLPNPDGSYGFVKVEGLFNLGRDRLYASGGNGSIFRIDTDTGMGTCLGTPIADRRSRLASLRFGPDGAAYGVTGRDGRCEVIRFDPVKGTWRLLGPVADGDAVCWQVHDVCLTPEGTLYACENDNPYRSGYLWKIKL